MPVNLKAKKQLVARMYKVGVNRVRFDSDHLDDIADAITREISEVYSQQIQLELNQSKVRHEDELK